MAEKDKEPLLGYTGAFRRPNYKFYREEWVRWLRYDYRTTLAPDRLDEFWFRDENGSPRDEGKGSWLADLFALPNWGLLSSYFNVGVALNFLATPVSYYLVETLNSSSAIVNTYSAATYLPWCLKIFFGLQSDLVPLFGMHRRSYYAIGWIVFVVSNIWLMLMGTPSAMAVIMLSFVQTMGALLSDTVADAIVLECSKFESAADKGRLRTHGYLVRQVGSTLGSLMGALLYNGKRTGGGWGWARRKWAARAASSARKLRDGSKEALKPPVSSGGRSGVKERRPPGGS